MINFIFQVGVMNDFPPAHTRRENANNNENDQ